MAEKKKILYIVEAMGGGVFTYIVDLANELVDTYDMYIAYAVRKQTPSNYKDYFDKRIHLIEVKNFGRAINPVKDFASLFEVKRIASEINPDVIHLHSSKAGVIGRIAFNGKIPMFYTPHGYSFLMENYKPMKRAMFKLIETVLRESAAAEAAGLYRLGDAALDICKRSRAKSTDAAGTAVCGPLAGNAGKECGAAALGRCWYRQEFYGGLHCQCPDGTGSDRLHDEFCPNHE